MSISISLTLVSQLIAVQPLPWPSPPPLQPIEWQPARPSARHVWIGGHFVPNGGKLTWQAGRWSVPPEAGLRWEPAQWDDRGGRWVFLRGHFRPVRPFDPTHVYQPPSEPAPPVAAPPAPAEQHAESGPAPDAIWVPGYWHWDGVGFLWVAGRWSVRP